jgi:L-amino acid N-acyltransferase YncA
MERVSRLATPPSRLTLLKWDREHLRDCSLAVRDRQRTLGWVALSAISKRGVYSGVAEVSIYVAAEARDRGIGKTLLRALVEESERCGIWTLQAGIFPENAPSIALHKSCEFREVGLRQRLGKQGDRWRDVLLGAAQSQGWHLTPATFYAVAVSFPGIQ